MKLFNYLDPWIPYLATSSKIDFWYFGYNPKNKRQNDINPPVVSSPANKNKNNWCTAYYKLSLFSWEKYTFKN